MYTKDTTSPASSVCPIENTLRILDGKWRVTILYYLKTEGTLRFSELQKSIPAVTQRMLTAQLRELEKKGIVARTVYPVVPPKVEYNLTELGESLSPILKAMQTWSEQHATENN